MGDLARVEPGTNPAFLYQQNTLRDAILAGVTFHIFHNHCERIHMANIAQTVNVLQAMVLTEGEKMILTPTYHVFEMFKGHQDATRLPILLQGQDYTFDGEAIPQISASASRNLQGQILVTACNLNPNQPAELACTLAGTKVTRVTGRVLTAKAMNAFNTFEAPNAVTPKPFDRATLDGDKLTMTLPAMSVIAVTLT
jgi:alpha-N-arabinofuranosidase